MKRKLTSVFYVDDEPDIREVVELCLGLAEDLRVQTCDSGERALELLPVVKPDILLLDVMMPGLDGPATLQRMRADPGLNDLPVIFMTAKALPEEIERFLALGAVAVIPKPFDPFQLAGQVTTIWESLDHG